ncbi:hypothetical protein EG329_007940 [Mollisiaceae sp. DMI_Dod_QoI]|nr:hypothetical protein EG329_007940 [Helotiales sp. DMI_Dod_QoI]
MGPTEYSSPPYQQQAEWEDHQKPYLKPLTQTIIHTSDLDINQIGLNETTALSPIDLKWQPSYLRRPILIGFTILFALIIVALEVLEATSQRNYGLATSYPGLHYLWTYGPTVVLTLVASLWYRVEFQTKMITPWVRMFNRSDTASKTLLQDYVSSPPPSLFRHAFRNKDWAVFATAAVSVVIKILIILSTGLITLSLTQVPVDNVAIPLKDTFIDSDLKLQNPDQSLSFYSMQGLLRDNIKVPAGTTPDFAYQEIDTTSGELGSASQVQATVAGFTNSLDCELANLSLIYAVPPIRYLLDGYSTNMSVTSPSCSATFKILGPGWNETYGTSNSSLAFFTRLATSQCNGTSDESGMRLLVLFGLMNYTEDYSRNYSDMSGAQYPTPFGKLVQSTQLLCVPTYRLTDVNVVQNGTQTLSLSETAGSANWTLKTVQPWQLMQAHLDSYNNEAMSLESGGLSSTYVNISGSPQLLDVDQYMNVSVTMYVPSHTPVQQFYDPEFLQNVTTRYYRQYTAIIAKEVLMSTNATANGTAPLVVTGSYVAYENRLVVRMWSAQWMAGLLAICMVLSLATVFILPGHSVVPQNPSSLYGMAALFSNSWVLLEDLRDAGGGKEKILNKNLKSSRFTSRFFVGEGADPRIPAQFIIERRAEDDSEDSDGPRLPQTEAKNTRPIMLRPSTRIAIVLTTIALIITLELTLFRSKSKGCLGYVANDAYIHYAWTAIPALVFATLAMVFSAFDFTLRSVMPYIRLKTMVSMDEFMNLEFLDCSVLRAMYQQVRLRHFPALAATTSLLIASLFTIFSSSLFQAIPQPVTVPVSLQAVNSFPSNADPEPESQELASFVLQGLYDTYPQWTWAEMAFPEFNLTRPWSTGAMSLDSSQYTLETVIPAVRSHMTCRLYDSSAMQYNLTVGFIGLSAYSGFNMTNTLGVVIDGEGCELNRSDATDQYTPYMGYNAYLSTENNGYFGFGEATDAATISQGCSELLYVWGHVNYNVTPEVTFISAMGCNETFESVDVDTTFTGTNFTMSANSPPVPRESTVRNTTATPGAFEERMANPYSFLTQVPPDNPADQFDQFFSLLTTSSKNNLSSSALGTADQIPVVSAAIQQQHGMIQAQNLNGHRVPANTTNATLPLGATGKTDADYTYNGNLTDPLGGGRGLCVSQDAASTHILAALLGTALLLFVFSWVGMPKTAVLPRRAPLSIASMVALIAGGNLLSYLPPNADSCSDEEIRQSLGRHGEMSVWLGWGNVTDVEGRMARQENEGGVSRFGIFVVPPGMVERQSLRSIKGR